MTPELIGAYAAAAVAVIGAVTALVRQLQHQGDPGAHGGQGHP